MMFKIFSGIVFTVFAGIYVMFMVLISLNNIVI
jgi:hypothetical protein